MPQPRATGGIRDTVVFLVQCRRRPGRIYILVYSLVVGSYGGLLSFDLTQQSSTTSPFDKSTPNPGTTWTSYAITLAKETGWLPNSSEAASELDMRDVLSDIAAIRTNEYYRTGSDTGRLDNVVLESTCDVEESSAIPSQSPTEAFVLSLYNNDFESPQSPMPANCGFNLKKQEVVTFYSTELVSPLSVKPVHLTLHERQRSHTCCMHIF